MAIRTGDWVPRISLWQGNLLPSSLIRVKSVKISDSLILQFARAVSIGPRGLN